MRTGLPGRCFTPRDNRVTPQMRIEAAQHSALASLVRPYKNAIVIIAQINLPATPAYARILRFGLSLVVRNRDGNRSCAGIARRVGALNRNRVHAVASISRAIRPQHDLEGTHYLPIG
jgi:hypothetical protein